MLNMFSNNHDNHDLFSHNKNTPKGEKINCVICLKKFKSEKNLKTHDFRYHMKKEYKHKKVQLKHIQREPSIKKIEIHLRSKKYKVDVEVVFSIEKT